MTLYPVDQLPAAVGRHLRPNRIPGGGVYQPKGMQAHVAECSHDACHVVRALRAHQNHRHPVGQVSLEV
jgi:hypothetical protein